MRKWIKIVTCSILIFSTAAFLYNAAAEEKTNNEEISIEEIENVAEEISTPQGDFIFIEGDIKIRKKGEEEWIQVTEKTQLSEESEIELGSNSYIEVVVSEKSSLDINEETRIRIIKKDKNVTLDMMFGSLKAKVQKLEDEEIVIKTPIAVAAVRGTEFAVLYEDKESSEIEVYDGSVSVKNVPLKKEDSGTEIEVTKDKWVYVKSGMRPEIRGMITEERKIRWDHIKSKKQLFLSIRKLKRLEMVNIKLDKFSKVVRNPAKKKILAEKLSENKERISALKEDILKNREIIDKFRSKYKKMRKNRNKNIRSTIKKKMKSRMKERMKKHGKKNIRK
ncbi:FecR domain-containing protein [Elusimicrobiota bacterium]